MSDTPCILCAVQKMQEGAELPDIKKEIHEIDCTVCKKTRITFEALSMLIGKGIPAYLVKGYLRLRNQEGKSIRDITKENLENIIASPWIPWNVSDKFDRLLLSLGNLTNFGGEKIRLEYSYDYPLSFAKNPDEMKYILRELTEWGYVKSSFDLDVIKDSNEFMILTDGWKRIEELKSRESDSKQCFVAMAFDKEMDAVYEKAIKKAVQEAGFVSYRMDRTEHIELIPYKMLADIRKSRFVVADFTLQRGGVYFEAGFAMGLGLPVIWICQKDDF